MAMLIPGKGFVPKISSCSYLLQRERRGTKIFATTFAQRKDLSDTSNTKPRPLFQLKVSNIFLSRAILAVFGLGFIDAGYSGDWSRIGVISKESEDLLKIAAFAVVPLCIFLIFSFSKDTED
ncbi:hypothetical protein RJ641_025418 [Dillenia turbinata]|uniref:DUF7887 domain-containing protein n=1 Tax=Dillenia turbinata TaxID=194707 RepID=A0AAN8W9A7_9MAGN